MMMQVPAQPHLTLEVCFTPKLYPEIQTKEPFIVVLVDILRATTSICAAFENGVKEILPVATHEEARTMKERGFLVATELDGKKLDFADFGNSALNFTREAIGGKTLVYCTTNGTKALAMTSGAETVAMGAFINLSALAGWLWARQRNIVILCSGWKNRFCLEDTLFAGALAERLLGTGQFTSNCDAAEAALDLWNIARGDMHGYIEKAAHRHRLAKLGLDDVLPYTFTLDSTSVVPVYRNGKITNEQ